MAKLTEEQKQVIDEPVNWLINEVMICVMSNTPIKSETRAELMDNVYEQVQKLLAEAERRTVCSHFTKEEIERLQSNCCVAQHEFNTHEGDLIDKLEELSQLRDKISEEKGEV